jgi:putative membrane-bound dehydrogenase-like protein
MCIAACKGLAGECEAQIPHPGDAPPPLSSEASAASFRLPPGYRIELIAREPLVREPSGICWDEHGRLFVCELHGYNLEGQYDIEALNKTGKLDRVVRRVQADEKAQEAAKQGTKGTVKLLLDTNGDGRMDKAEVWADDLHPCYGICPARGGLIVACAPDIVFLADRDKNGKPEVREKLFTGFATGALERGVNAPKWGPDNWIYFGRGHGGGRITGPYLKSPVNLPNTDFRIKSDGSALEPIPGGTHTIGFTFTAAGERFVTNTQSPALHVAPIPWRCLARNRDMAIGGLEHQAAPDGKVFPVSRPHPWRTKRAEDPGFAKFYTDRYGIAESAPNGYFTSACSPLVYQDRVLGGLHGQLLCCEPAQNLIHRATLVRSGLRFGLRRPQGEEQSEFLASTDPWFHPIALSHAPDGSIWIVDFYREIIEDYSAIPRYLQQQYGLTNGHDHGRLWRLTAGETPSSPSPDLGKLPDGQLVAELASPLFWRRQTARRLLIEREAKETATAIEALLASAEPSIAINALYALDGLVAIKATHVEKLLSHDAGAVLVHALRAAERFFGEQPTLARRALQLADDARDEVRLQVALTLGEVREEQVLAALAGLALQPDADPWLQQAVLTSLAGRGERMLAEVLATAGHVADAKVSLSASRFLEPLAAMIAARRDPAELSSSLARIASASNVELQTAFLRGILSRFKNTRTKMPLDDPARQALRLLTEHPEEQTRELGQALTIAWQLESAQERIARLAVARRNVGDVQAASERRIAAVAELALEQDEAATQSLVEAFASATPPLRDAILNALFAHKNRLGAVMSAIESDAIPAPALSAVQRRELLENGDAGLRDRAAQRFSAKRTIDERTVKRFAAALETPGDSVRGERVFRAKCATCHRAHGIGVDVGPDLTAEIQRRPETILNDILAPSDSIAAGYTTYVVETVAGQVFTGVFASETAGSVALRLADGKEQIIFRKDIERLLTTSVSMMADNLADTLEPEDVAGVIAWLSRRPQ